MHAYTYSHRYVLSGDKIANLLSEERVWCPMNILQVSASKASSLVCLNTVHGPLDRCKLTSSWKMGLIPTLRREALKSK